MKEKLITKQERDGFIDEANRETAREYAEKNRAKMSEDEITVYLLKTAKFTKAEAQEIARELKN